MVKTRNQTRDAIVKKEEEDCKPSPGLNEATMTTRSKIAKPKPSTTKNRNLRAPEVKVEQDIDIKSVLKTSKPPKGQRISQEQIKQLIDYVVNHGMGVTEASHKVNIHRVTGSKYYKEYENDPEKKIPSRRNRYVQAERIYTQENIGNLIKYVVDDKMPVREASAKANLPYRSGKYYYDKYLKDPAHHIPTPRLCQYYTQDQKDQFIRYVINDKMSMHAASKKAKMDVSAGIRYYHEYFGDQNLDIATPSHITIPKRYTQEQKKEVISYIADDKMSIAAAPRKTKINASTCRDWYRKYFKNQNPNVPTPSHITIPKRYTQEQKKELISYIFGDKMSIADASRKVNMSPHSAGYCYRRYLKDKNMEFYESKYRKGYTQDDINKVVGYIVDGKMIILAASKKSKYEL